MADSSHNQRHASGWVFGIFSGIFLALLALYCFWTLLISGAFPPAWYERRAQRQKLIERIQAAGGWEALRRDCIALAKTNENEIFRWARWVTNAPTLPPAIMALQPQEVYYVSSKFHTGVPDEPQIPIVRIKVFGMHSSGGHSTPYFGLDVVTTPSKVDYSPNARRAVPGNGHMDHRKLVEGVYEIF
jgi:hypothetical protein